MPSILKSKELLLNLPYALKCLDRLTSDVSSNTTRLLHYAEPHWRNRKNLEANISDIKMTSLQLKSSLHQFVEFSEGCLGNSMNASDKGINECFIINSILI